MAHGLTGGLGAAVQSLSVVSRLWRGTRAASPVVRLIVERLSIFQFQKLLGFLSLFDQNLEQLNVRKPR